MPCLQAIYDNSDDDFKKQPINAYCLPNGKFEKYFYNMYQLPPATQNCDVYLHTLMPSGLFESFDWNDEDLIHGVSNWLYGLGYPGTNGTFNTLFEAKGEYAPISKTGWKKWAVTNTTQYKDELINGVGLSETQYNGVKQGSLNVVSYPGSRLFVPILKGLLKNMTSKLPEVVKLQDIVIYQMSELALTGGTDILALGGGALAVLLPILVKTFPQNGFTSLELVAFAQKSIDQFSIMNEWVCEMKLDVLQDYPFEPTRELFSIATDNCRWQGLGCSVSTEGLSPRAIKFKKQYEDKDYKGANDTLKGICKDLWDESVGGDCLDFFYNFAPTNMKDSQTPPSPTPDSGTSNSTSNITTKGEFLVSGASPHSPFPLTKVNFLVLDLSNDSSASTAAPVSGDSSSNSIPLILRKANWNICAFMGYLTQHLQLFGERLLDVQNMGLINRKSVKDIALGYNDPFLAMQNMPSFVPGTLRNWPTDLDALNDPTNVDVTVKTGIDNSKVTMEWTKWNNTHIQPQSIFPKADDYQRAVRGHDAQQFPGADAKYDDYSPANTSYELFLDQAFRYLPIEYSHNEKVKGITCGKFILPPKLLYPDQYNNSYYGVTTAGAMPLLDAMKAPIVLSQPYFYHGSAVFENQVGITTIPDSNVQDELLQTILYIEPWTGATFKALERLQINLWFMEEFSQQLPWTRYGGKGAVVPYLWVEIYQELTDDQADTFNNTVKSATFWAYFSYIAGPIIGGLCMIAGFVLIYLWLRAGGKKGHEKRESIAKEYRLSHTSTGDMVMANASNKRLRDESLYDSVYSNPNKIDQETNV